jgi:hypothetical protein
VSGCLEGDVGDKLPHLLQPLPGALVQEPKEVTFFGVFPNWMRIFLKKSRSLQKHFVKMKKNFHIMPGRVQYSKAASAVVSQ